MNSTTKFALVNLIIPGKKANREHTGGFGSFMAAEGFIGNIISKLKSSLIELPVLSLVYTKSLLRQAGFEVEVVSTGNLPLDTNIAIVINSMHCYKDELSWIQNQRKINPTVRIGVYGPFADSKPDLFLDGVDFIIGGELESAILAFINNKHAFNGHLNFGVVENLDILPIPDWSDFSIGEFNYFPLLHKKGVMPLQSSRGCSFNCDFCPYMVSQTKLFRRRSPKLIIDEIIYAHKKLGVHSFLFRDICFTLNKAHASSIAQLLIDEAINIEWACETRIDCLNEELIDLMYLSGLRGVNLGIETGNNAILKESGKKNPEIADQERIITYLKKKKIRINAFYMLGLSRDTVESMKNTIQYAKHLNTMGAQFCITTPFPGTTLFEKSKKNLLTEDFSLFTEYIPVLDIETATPAEISSAHTRAFQTYYIRLRWLFYYGPILFYRLLINILGTLNTKLL